MKIVKLSHPTGWDGDFKSQFPTKDCIWGDYKFEINNSVKECDFWVIHESVNREERVKCTKDNVLFITSEEKQQKPLYSSNYLSQFSSIITTRDDIVHPNVIRYQYLSPWHIKKTYSELIAFSTIEKKMNLSTITSDIAVTNGHKRRYAFINRMKGHFKDKLIWFGKGEQFIQDKWDGLQDFKYSIAIENSPAPYYWTEKIADCFLALTMPIYYGCPNITDYFPKESFIQIDLDNYKSSIEKIEETIEEDHYQSNFKYLQQARNLLLNQYQFVPALINLLDKRFQIVPNNKQKVVIKPERKYLQTSLQNRLINKILDKINLNGY